MRSGFFVFLYFFMCSSGSLQFDFGTSSGPSSNKLEQCFCRLKGYIDDCTCSVDTVDYYNNVKIYPRINSLLSRDYFRFYQANLQRECPYWPDDSKCAIRYCSVQSCSEDEIPDGLKGSHVNKKAHQMYTEEAQENSDCDDELGSIDNTISENNAKGFELWKQHDHKQENFCDVGDEEESELQFVDLILNPERYTGYKGESAHKIWNSIYQENCFKPKRKQKYGPLVDSENTGGTNPYEGLCLEERAFYRAISGLHASINIHLSARYLLQDKHDFGSTETKWGPNLNEFVKRFSPDATNGAGPQWLKNLYFVYLLELGALAKATPYLKQVSYYTGNSEEDSDLGNAIEDILSIVESFPDHFNASLMFQSEGAAGEKLKAEFRNHFLNISRIMDCVGCEKCKLWGKLQTHGLGTALKILFSNQEEEDESGTLKLQLTRNEIVALFNAFGRLSNSIHELEKFRQRIQGS